jgi:hypothetical protein
MINMRANMMNLGFMVMEKLDIVNDITSARILKPVLMQKQKTQLIMTTKSYKLYISQPVISSYF